MTVAGVLFSVLFYSLYLPWAFKWAVGPIVDSLTVDRWGPRRFWVVLAQGLMVATLLAAMLVDPATVRGRPRTVPRGVTPPCGRRTPMPGPPRAPRGRGGGRRPGGWG